MTRSEIQADINRLFLLMYVFCKTDESIRIYQSTTKAMLELKEVLDKQDEEKKG